MSDIPWLTLIGLGEDGPDGLCSASRNALAQAECVMGAERHLSLLPDMTAERIVWPVPFADGIAVLMARRGTPTVVLASGDPFWFGAGTVLTRHLTSAEWRALPGRSVFSLAAARLGWALERSLCLGLHAAPFSRLQPHLAPGRQIIATLRDGSAVALLGAYLDGCGFGASACTVLEALGGPRERMTTCAAEALAGHAFAHPVCVAIRVAGSGAALPLVAGRADDWFGHDGQITKAPVRAMTLAALAPRPFEHLWDIGGGSGSVAIEWLLSNPSLRATCIERSSDRAARIRTNADRLGVDRLVVIEGQAPEALTGLDAPDAVFVGGGLSDALLTYLETLTPGTRLVVNAVTLESDALLGRIATRLGGSLMRLELSSAVPIGSKRGWRAAYPITQWSHRL
ncbi:MAG: precorrin-6y C5,15-methyltransferase (decarboxylating) subunit CbiE [Alphaproteobacteria bacterium]|jgi:precorrin-6Y C5,15-methyltransferase (decarboxylating)|nr:precorrin-6y C5,15-methyltransferase (decarboxylating) subunit CbiE [Alphaproteobacteria bacterium]